MGSAPGFTVALGVCGLLLATVSLGGQERRAPPVYGEVPEQRTDPVVERESARAPAPVDAPRAASPAARPSEPGPSPTALSKVAETPAAMPPGLSKDAPETAPNIGVGGRGKANGRSRGGSPAATPEPSTLLLMGAGLAGLYGLRRRR